jgi:formate hydrogenlyase transcriptional activator
MDDRRQMEELLLERLQFETLLSDLSAIFVNLPPDKVDDEIEGSVRRIVEFLGFDRGTLYQTSEDGRGLIPTHVWAKPGFEGQLKFLPAKKAPWL